jgi:anti-sigma factor RsiW
MSACSDKLLLLNGLIDGELDAANILTVEAHLRTCAECRAELAQIEAVRDLLADEALDHQAPAALRERVDAMLAQSAASSKAQASQSTGTSTATRYWRKGAGGLAGHIWNGRWASGALAGVAATLALVLALPQMTHTGTEDQLVESHVRSLMVGHLTDIATSNRHVVKPWFNGKIDFAPPVPELAKDGFPLVGGRLDYVDDHAVAAIVYRRQLHTINLFVRPAGALTLPFTVTRRRDGYNLMRWTKGSLEYWAVSDVELRELELFHRIFLERTAA